MENVYFQIFFRPVVDKSGEVKYRKVKVLKKRNNTEENLTKGRLLRFISKQFETISPKLGKNERLLVEIPLDFLLSRSLIEEMEADKVNLLLDFPVLKINQERLFRIKKLFWEYRKAGFEFSFNSKAFMKYRHHFPSNLVSFVCLPAEDRLKFHKNCFYNIDNEESFKKVFQKGDYFCGDLFGEYELVAEVNALNYLQTTVSNAVDLVENENVDIGELETIIKTDPHLVTALVKYANSPLIAPPSPIKDLTHAIVYLGLKRLKQFLMVIMLNRLATLDPDLEKIALRLSAVGFLATWVPISKASQANL